MARQLSRKPQSRNRLVRNLVSSLFLHGEIKTTAPKAKVAKSEAERLIALLGKVDGFDRTRKAKQYLYGGAVAKGIDFAKKFKSVAIYKLGPRSGDGAPQSLVVLKAEGEKLDEPAGDARQSKKTAKGASKPNKGANIKKK